MSKSAAVQTTSLSGFKSRGKVRDIYDLGDVLMIVATDRISAFDVVMNEPIPGKGVVLTQMSRFWLEQLPACAPHHLKYVVSREKCPPGYEKNVEQLAGRAMVVRKARVLPVECVVRGYLVGGGWKEYQQTGHVSGIELPRGLKLAEKLPQPIFTPSTKATHGHDEPISFEQARELAGGDAMNAARKRSLDIYTSGAAYAEKRGIILADTKFEFGHSESGELLLIDEVLTPDSSRFWPADEYQIGRNPPSYDKQFLRDYLETLGWNKQPPPPPIPAEIIEKSRARYEEAFARLTK